MFLVGSFISATSDLAQRKKYPRHKFQFAQVWDPRQKSPTHRFPYLWGLGSPAESLVLSKSSGWALGQACRPCSPFLSRCGHAGSYCVAMEASPWQADYPLRPWPSSKATAPPKDPRGPRCPRCPRTHGPRVQGAQGAQGPKGPKKGPRAQRPQGP